MNSDLTFYYLTSNFIVIILLLIYIQFDNDCYSEKRDFFALIISAVLGGGVGVMVEPVLFFPAMERRGWSNRSRNRNISINISGT